MAELTLQLPEELDARLRRLAAEQDRTVEDMALERLASLVERAEEDLKQRYERFFRESGLFIQHSEEEKARYQPVSEERRRELAAKLGAAGPLSEVIIEERGER